MGGDELMGNKGLYFDLEFSIYYIENEKSFRLKKNHVIFRLVNVSTKCIT